MSIELLPKFIQENYEIHEWKHATTILYGDFPNEWNDITQTLTDFRLRKSWITVGGGQKSNIAEWIDDRLIKEKNGKKKHSIQKCSLIIRNIFPQLIKLTVTRTGLH